METRPFKPKLPEIAESEQTPVVRSLWQVMADWQAEVQRLEDAVRRLKGGPPRPQLKPTTLEAVVAAALNPTDETLPRRRGHPQRAKTAERVIHETGQVVLEPVPEGSRFQGYRSYVVEDVVIRLQNPCYAREPWQFPTGESVTAPVPVAGRGGHDGPQWVSSRLHQHDHAHVTQPILLAQVREWGIAISAGPLDRLLTEGHEDFHQDKADLKTMGLAVSTSVQTDDTGARHPGKNGYCTDLGNEWCAGLASPDSKRRVNVLELLQTERGDAITPAALT